MMNQAHPRHKRLLRLQTSRIGIRSSNYMLSDNHKFDETTGQIYTETTASIQSTDDRGWTRRSIEPGSRDSEDELQLRKTSRSQEGLGNYREYLHSVKPPTASHFKGVRSLQATSFESVLQHMSDVTLEGLECLPIQVVRRLWHAVNRRCILSFEIWTIFSKLLHQDEEATLDLLRYRQDIKKPMSPLHVYTTPLTSASFDFISSLSITVSFPLPDLVKIAAMKNLGALEIINQLGTSAVTDRLIRTWHHAAVDDGAFCVLRIMRLWGHPELTARSLVYLDSFPALAVYDVRWCTVEQGAAILNGPGWKPTLDPNTLGLLSSACIQRAVMMQRKLRIEPTPTQRASWLPLRDGSKIKRIPRSEVANFLIQPQTEEPPIEDEMSSRVQTSQAPKKTNMRTYSKGSTTWEFATNAISRIGELRNDRDLSRAGIDVKDQVVVGNELVNSVPIASIRLGPSTGWMLDWEKSVCDTWDSMFSPYANSGDQETFIRIKVPKGPVGKKEKATTANIFPRSGNDRPVGSEFNARDAVMESASLQKTPAKSGQSTFIRGKKRKIGDILSSFT